MRATFQYHQTLVQDQENSSTVLDVFPRFLDTPGLIDQDFTMIFGEDASGRFLEKWPTYFKPRILANSKNSNEFVEDLLSGNQRSDGSAFPLGWDSDLSSILLLIHLLPPHCKRTQGPRISSYQAV
ncbi:unnamed protein product [Arctogadus glacialis]